MRSYQSDHKDALLQSLYELINQRLPAERSAELTEFASKYFASASAADLEEWRLEDLYGSTLAFWQFMQKRKPDQAKVRVFNPDYEQFGWQSTHTVIEVLHAYMPFIVDSLRMELNRRNLTIHAIHNAVLTLKRDQRHCFQGLLAKESRAKGAVRESLVAIEVDRRTDPSELTDLEQTLNAILEDVSLVVEDFEPMVARCDMLVSEFDKVPESLAKQDVAEALDFVSWLKQHFTFLGYDEFELQQQADGTMLMPVLGSQLGLLKFCDEHCRSELVSSPRDAGEFELIPEILSFSKSPNKSRVHRPAYPDYISVKRFDDRGRVVGESRFLGLYTSAVYNQSARRIPVVRRKLDEVLNRSGLFRFGHDWKELMQILEIYPRDDLFQIDVDSLYETAMGILHIHERRQIRLFLRRDRYGRFFSCLVYAPREVYSTEFRTRVQDILCRELACDQVDFNTYFSESILARTQYLLRSSSGSVAEQVDVQQLEKQVRQAARGWSDDLYDALVESAGEERGIRLYNNYGSAFSASYRASFNASSAVVDIQHMEKLSEARPIELSFYRALEKSTELISFKLFHLATPLPLSDVLPVLENFGLRVIDEYTYPVQHARATLWIHDFNLAYRGTESISFNLLQTVFEKAFLAVWQGKADSDHFNRLVLSTRSGWRDVAMLRAYAAYMKQTLFPISRSAISEALNRHAGLSRCLVELFYARFDPQQHSERKQRALEERLLEGLEQVRSLTEDRVIRQYLALFKATLRCNFFQHRRGPARSCFAFKLAPERIPLMPKPRPRYEIFVHSPRMEGVHLRSGKIARGGLRWSDRHEDFRTEILGLVKAQQVKNALIVPIGAKGGFIAKRLHDGMSREQRLAEGETCYRVFINTLLDITDNLKAQKVLPPPDMVRYDRDDSYLVVAADKGTASFSDIANELACKHGFWLGDAFASGGSHGYDHKKMGITARGAWVSVERHFRELGRNTGSEDFTVLGIGDMSGDVFGNGMLLSKHIRLLAAFNHQHIFIDPEPDPQRSWQERQRLFKLRRSSWADYDGTLISKGGGVYERSAKSIALSPQARKLTGLKARQVTPAELVSALLTMEVDLLWNGGIGTYVKASDESHAEVGDKANDAVRANADQLRARVIGEGGNLGLTQRARMEFAARGGRINTDFIDNAGGVDCSDREVNLKILLNQLVRDGDMTEKQRNKLLLDMTDEVAGLVLQDIYRQVQAISLDEARSLSNMPEYRRLINNLEASGRLDRALESLPDDEQLIERHGRSQGLSRPELAVLICYSKSEFKAMLAKAPLMDDPYLAKELAVAFPAVISERFIDQLKNHRLKREIIANQIANQLVNFMGINAPSRLRASSGAAPAIIARAYILARDVFDIVPLWRRLETLDYQIDAAVQLEMMLNLQHLMRRATRWFARNRRGSLDTAAEVHSFRESLEKVCHRLGELLQGKPKQRWLMAYQRYLEAGVPDRVAELVAGAPILYTLLGMIEVARKSRQSEDLVATTYFELGDRLGLYLLAQQLNELEVVNHWQALARETFRDELDTQHQALTRHLLQLGEQAGHTRPPDVDGWMAANKELMERWQVVLSELQNAERPEYAMYTVAIRELCDLANAGSYLDSMVEVEGK
ncbi:NAD-glutamate dehydrogenase [Marinobacterium arenosum]|uniref:NAD-glutamate dehydrogenase n=1 Tax=Marinobacterium arenosum TaxID=2862496 RepID=UPI001C93AF40|nr:NAD-glutamate dehydrogenase [Marinobacterium arenosum]MBY4677995.1 NAD-glutamate dehydrogenase [Marinobacterium arenosum]